MTDLQINTTLNQQQQDQYLIPHDKWIILVDNRNQSRLIKLSTHKKFNWRKTQINITELLEQPFYQLLEVGNNTLKPIQFENPDEEDNNQQQENNQVQQQNVKDQMEVKQNNKEMYTLQDAQKLHAEDIEKLRKQKTPQELINQLVENNQQFEKRTAYSKAKYLKKKQRKYIFNFHVEPVSLDNIHQYYFKNDYKYIGGIRWDMLGLLLLHAGPIDRVLVSERTKGIVLGSVILRDAKSIDFVSLQQKNIKNFPVVDQMNIDRQEAKKVTFHTWENLKNNPDNRPVGKFNSFILLGNFDFAQIIKTVEQMKLLSSNTSLAFYCHSLEPILECFNKLRREYKNFLNIRIYDSWCREYQVLKNRTHPLMYMDSRSGYLLTAIRVDPRSHV